MRTALSRRAGIISTYLLLSSLLACASQKIPPSATAVVARESLTRRPLESVRFQLLSPGGQTFDLPVATDRLGFTRLTWRKLVPTLPRRPDLTDYRLVYAYTFSPASGPEQRADTLLLNPYLSLVDLYLDSLPARPDRHPARCHPPVADMHYHVSMRTHNLFGNELYEDPPAAHRVPPTLNLFKSYRKLRVLDEGRWRKPYLGPIDYPRLATSRKWQRREHRMATLLEQEWVRPKGASNFLTHYTQATHPHLVQGGVFLAYNAFSPFERNVASTPQKRFVNRNFATGASRNWLRRIGQKSSPLSHWKNFLNEYATLQSQRGFYESFACRNYDFHTDLADSIPTIVNVVEGAHVFQDELFPQVIDYDLTRRSFRKSIELFNGVVEAGRLVPGRPERIQFEALADTLADRLTPAGREVVQQLLAQPTRSLGKGEWRDLGTVGQDSLDAYVDGLLIDELRSNIRAVKQLSGPPICMVTIAHLTYNGMTGHAPNLDGGKFPTNIIAQKNYNIRVSDDPTYKSQWASAFFTVPGVNKFGRALIEELTTPDADGHRIYIDLKHSDFFTREYFFRNVMGQGENRMPPICSHGAVTGLPNPYYSPLSDEYSLLRAPSTTTFNPFGINLYDEEIATICTNGGIIGITLEQRVLGGYINAKRQRPYHIDRRGRITRGKANEIKRWEEIERLFLHFAATDTLIHPLLRYTRDSMGVRPQDVRTPLHQDRNLLAIATEDYISAEPFLQNLFHIIDHSGLPPREAWKHVCIGSDLDGLIDPIDICPTASHYPRFRERLAQFIPVFLALRQFNDPTGQARNLADYFDTGFTIDDALHQLFYLSLRDFTARHFVLTSSPATR